MEISKLMHEVKKDKEMFGLLICQFDPMIKKYVKHLYKDEAEDVRAELIVALWEAVCNITFYDNEGQVVSYLSRAIKNKFLELYRKSCKQNDNIIAVEEDELQNRAGFDHSFEDMMTVGDLNRFEGKLEGKKKEIFRLIFLKEYTDMEVAEKLGVSRQYVHRIKRFLVEKIREEVLGISIERSQR